MTTTVPKTTVKPETTQILTWALMFEMVERILIARSGGDATLLKLAWELLHLIVDVDFTTMCHMKRNGVTDFMFEEFKRLGYKGWDGQVAATVGDVKTGTQRTIVLMDPTVRTVYDKLRKNGARITFVTARGPAEQANTMTELKAMGISEPEVVCAGKTPKAQAFMEACYPVGRLSGKYFVVFDDETRHFEPFMAHEKLRDRVLCIEYEATNSIGRAA